MRMKRKARKHFVSLEEALKKKIKAAKQEARRDALALLDEPTPTLAALLADAEEADELDLR